MPGVQDGNGLRIDGVDLRVEILYNGSRRSVPHNGTHNGAHVGTGHSGTHGS